MVSDKARAAQTVARPAAAESPAIATNKGHKKQSPATYGPRPRLHIFADWH